MDIFKTNTLSSHIVKFKQPIVLKGEYDVGLAEIQYPRSWNNIRTSGNTFELFHSYPRNGKERSMIKEVTPSYYENIPDLIDVIKSTCGSTLDKSLQTNSN